MKSKAKKVLAVAATLAIVCSVAFVAPVYADGLSFDSDHDVLVLPENELSIKYNNKTFAPVKATNAANQSPHFLKYPVKAAVKLSEDFSSMSISQSPETIVIEGYDSGLIGPLGTNRFSPEFLKDNFVRIVVYSTDRIAKESGFPESAVQAMRSVMAFEVKPKSGTEPYNLFAFQHGEHVTLFARRMRSGRADIKNDPPVIIVDMRVGSTKESKGNVVLAEPTASSEIKSAEGADAAESGGEQTGRNKPSSN